MPFLEEGIPGSSELTVALRRMARFFEEVSFVADRPLAEVGADSGRTAPTTSAWFPLGQSGAADNEHYAPAVCVPADTYGVIDFSVAEGTAAVPGAQVTAQRRVIRVPATAEAVRLTQMSFDAEGKQPIRRGAARLWAGFWIPDAASLASMLQDLSVWSSDPASSADSPGLRRAVLASRRTAHSMLALMPSLASWEAEGLDSIYGESPVPPSGRPRMQDVSWEHVHAGRFRIEAIWAELVRQNCPPSATIVPYAHIDNAWFMPESLTEHLVRGAAGTLLRATQDGAPPPHFGPAMYWASLQRTDPQTFSALGAVVEGDPALLPSTWSEPDFALLSGDSIVAQFRLARRFALQSWGAFATSAWFPDAPGFPAVLPQLLSDAGIRFLYTARLRFNPPRLRTPPGFTWHAAGGAAVDVEVSYTPQGYLGTVSASDLQKGSLEALTTPVYAIGYSGGGAPTETEWGALSNLRRAGVAHRPLRERLRPEDRSAPDSEPCSTWSGPLELFAHRGMATVAPDTKELFREAEIVLEGCKLSACFLEPGTELEAAQYVMLDAATSLAELQSHDTIDGTVPSDVSRRTREALLTLVSKLRDHRRLITLGPSKTGPVAPAIFVHSGTAAIRPQMAVNRPAPGRQQTSDGFLYAPTTFVEPGDTFTVRKDSGADVRVEPTAGGVRLCNEFVSVTIYRDGTLSFEDPTGVELGRTDALNLNLDVPSWYDGWDIDTLNDLTQGRCVAEHLEVVEDGPVRATASLTFVLPGGGEITQSVALWRNSPRLNVEFQVERMPARSVIRWQVLSPGTTVLADAPYAVETVDGPTTLSTWSGERIATSWVARAADQRSVMVCAAAPFGYRLQGSIIDVGLFRAPLFPDPTASASTQRRRFSIVPTAARTAAQLQREAAECSAQMTGTIERTSRRSASEPEFLSNLRSIAAVLPVSDLGIAESGPTCTAVNLSEGSIDLRTIAAAPARLRRLRIISEDPSHDGLVLARGEVARIRI